MDGRHCDSPDNCHHDVAGGVGGLPALAAASSHA